MHVEVIGIDVKLSVKPKNPIVIEGFPGFGLVGTIAAEFLTNHLECVQIGSYYFEDLPATIAIHQGTLIPPVSISYNKKYNLVIVHSISGATGIEWQAADLIHNVCKQLGATQLISLEGVGTASEVKEEAKAQVFYHTNNAALGKKMEALGVKRLEEGIIMGVTSAVLLKASCPVTCLFAETFSNLPDSKAAARTIEVLDKWLGLKVDYKPLLKQAEKFEEKIKTLIEQGMQAKEQVDKKTMSYVG